MQLNSAARLKSASAISKGNDPMGREVQQNNGYKSTDGHPKNDQGTPNQAPSQNGSLPPIPKLNVVSSELVPERQKRR
jgi:hypothetical protein